MQTFKTDKKIISDIINTKSDIIIINYDIINTQCDIININSDIIIINYEIINTQSDIIIRNSDILLILTFIRNR